jgi:hypothetical protein
MIGFFLFVTASRSALEPTQPPNQWVPRVFTLGAKRLVCEADHSVPRLRMLGVILPLLQYVFMA